MKKVLAAALFSITAIASGAAMAGEFADNAAVNIPGLGNYTLLKQGADAKGDGIYVLKHSSNQYLMAASGNEGEKVKFGPDQTKWILHENSTGWSIIAAANGANTVSKAGSGWVLQRNQGAPNQVWAINKK